MNFNKNRKGDERVLSLYWFILFIIVAIAIVSAVLIFYSYLLDVRQAETSILADRIVGCLSNNGQLNVAKLDEVEKNGIDAACNLVLTDNSQEKYSEMSSQYYIQIEVKGKLLRIGDQDFLAFCGQSSKTNIPVCYVKKLFILDNNEMTSMKITTIVRKVEQNAKG